VPVVAVCCEVVLVLVTVLIGLLLPVVTIMPLLLFFLVFILPTLLTTILVLPLVPSAALPTTVNVLATIPELLEEVLVLLVLVAKVPLLVVMTDDTCNPTDSRISTPKSTS